MAYCRFQEPIKEILNNNKEGLAPSLIFFLLSCIYLPKILWTFYFLWRYAIFWSHAKRFNYLNYPFMPDRSRCENTATYNYIKMMSLSLWSDNSCKNNPENSLNIFWKTKLYIYICIYIYKFASKRVKTV